KWTIKLKGLKAGGPDSLLIEGKNRLEIKNVLVGEVWVCGGQSNMELPVSRSFEPDAAIAASANPQLRLFFVPKKKADKPAENVAGSWKEASPETIPAFSAVAYFFGRE